MRRDRDMQNLLLQNHSKLCEIETGRYGSKNHNVKVMTQVEKIGS
jgi:hypothetical protein